MGKYKFRLSDMMPNAWFYKLRDMSRIHNTKKKLPPPTTISQKPHFSQPRNSYYYHHHHHHITEPARADKFYKSPTNPKSSDTHFPDPPRKSIKTRPKRRKTIYKPSPGLGHKTNPELSVAQDYFFSSTESSSPESECESSNNNIEDLWSSSSCSCRVTSSSTHIIIDMNEKSHFRKVEKLDGFEFDTILEPELPPILTKPVYFKHTNSQAPKLQTSPSKLGSIPTKICSTNTQKETKTSPPILKPGSKSTGAKLRANSPKIVTKKVQSYGRKSVSSYGKSSKSQRRRFSESFAVVKSSLDPQRDFKDSMVEMIVENNIHASKDLEELLACYLSLNSNEYHNLIVKAFEQVWFDMAGLGRL